ncbi:diguanylate cyclase domain-containing protein [Dactylosporangium sp. NPDC051541]|uniref:diguanylate cyclase domain-containing protein n=1 Tax=Dactylosporangium sp. NPDC051541 TaxID=3363977 RepID=UPI0037925F22
MAGAWTRYERLADTTVVAMLDIEGLKLVNDSEGHAVGDANLRAAATAMRRAL